MDYRVSLIVPLLMLWGCPTDDTVLDPSDDDDVADDDTAVGDDDSADDDDTAPADADGDGWTVEEGDCDDTDATIHPDAEDLACDGIDSDCQPDPELLVPDDHVAIQDAIDAAQGGDVVCVAPGTYVEQLDFDGKAIRVMGEAGPKATIVDGGGLGTVVTFDDGEPPEAVLEGLTITSGSAESGGGILVDNLSAPTLTNLVVRENDATRDGGGICALNGSTLILSWSVVTDNTAEGMGGGIHTEDASADMEALIIRDNAATNAGGLSLWYGDVLLTDSRIEANDSHNVGGFEASPNEGQLVTMVNVAVLENVARADLWHDGNAGGGQVNGWFTATNLLFAHNHADGSKGGLGISWEHPILTNVAVVGNTADERAGLYVGTQAATLNNILVAGNQATGEEGGMFLDTWGDGEISLSNLTIVGNTAAGCAGLMRHTMAPATLRNVLVAHNQGDESGTAECESRYDENIEWHNSVYWDNTPDETQDFDFPEGIDGNAFVDPVFLDISAADPLEWDLHLDPTSPLIDAGDPTVLDPDGSPSDIGAYGGPAAGGWDLDFDGFFEWWQPGPYDPATYPALGWDCDDGDETVYPGSGC